MVEEKIAKDKPTAIAQANLLRAIAKKYRERTVKASQSELFYRRQGDYVNALIWQVEGTAYAKVILDIESLAREIEGKFKKGGTNYVEKK